MRRANVELAKLSLLALDSVTSTDRLVSVPSPQSFTLPALDWLLPSIQRPRHLESHAWKAVTESSKTQIPLSWSRDYCT